MEWENCIVKFNVKAKKIDFDHPLNISNIESYSGTGFFIKNNLILTCYHVVQYAVNIEVIYKQTQNIEGKILHIFSDDDLAIVELIKEVPDCKILDFKIISTRQIGDVLTIGFPLSSTNIKVTKGIISGYQGSLIQTDATINSGNSGGPLIIKEADKYYIIGVNVSKMVGSAEGTGFVVPIYRFIILKKLIDTMKSPIVIRKPRFMYEFQKLIQDKLRNNIFRDPKLKKYIDNKSGVLVTRVNPSYYVNKYLKAGEIILSINSKTVDLYGTIKFDFYPEKIPLNEICLWFIPGERITMEILNPETQEIRTENITLEFINTNFIDFYALDSYPSYYVENNGLILSIITKQHIKIITENTDETLSIPYKQIVTIINNFMNQNNIFTVYLADLDYTKLTKFVKYPVGEIIVEINDKKFTTYDEFMKVVSEPITKIKTNDNKVFYMESTKELSTNELSDKELSTKEYFIKELVKLTTEAKPDNKYIIEYNQPKTSYQQLQEYYFSHFGRKI